MQLLEHFKALTLHPKNAQELKGLILQLAVQGKLTAQWRKENPDVEPASALLEKISLKKELLVKQKKIKKEKSLPEITEAEIPFNLPETWEWCRLIDVSVYIQRGKSPKYSEIKKYPVIAQKCIQWNEFQIYKAKFIEPDTLSKYGSERILKTDDLLWNSTGRGSLGRIGLYHENYNEYELAVADSHVTVIRVDKSNCKAEYVFKFLSSPIVQNSIESRSTGSTNQIELGTGIVKETIIPLPPLEEQKAIVEVVNTLLKVVEQLEQLTQARVQLKTDFVTSALQALTQAAEKDTDTQWAFLQEHFSAFFTEKANIKKLRESILQLAVQGKLTRDWRAQQKSEGIEVEPASVLLERIKAEKAQLVKDKKIKKEKPLPAISEDEIPHALPEGWVWCRMGELNRDIHYGYTASAIHTFIGTRMLRITDIQNNRVNWDRVPDCDIKEKDIPRYALNENDILIARTGGTIGKSYQVKGVNVSSVFASYLIRAIPMQQVFPEYLKRWIESPFYWKQLIENSQGTGQPNVNATALKGLAVSLPPLAEQKAIVSKVNSLMALCDSLEAEIGRQQTTQEQWMQSCLREVFEGDLV